MATKEADIFLLYTFEDHDGSSPLPIDFPLNYGYYVVRENHGMPLVFWREDIADPWPGKLPTVTVDDLSPDSGSGENWQAEFLAIRFVAVDAINALLGFETDQILKEGKTIISTNKGLVATIKPPSTSPYN
jgi:hypothetical protein